MTQDKTREAFARAIDNIDGNAAPLHEDSFNAGFQAGASHERARVREVLGSSKMRKIVRFHIFNTPNEDFCLLVKIVKALEV